MISTGYVSLFVSAFLAATFFPASSEVVLAGLAASGEFNHAWLLIVASAGNTLGSVVNWLLGRFCLRWQDRCWFPAKPETLEKASLWFNRYGVWSLLLSWVPIIGDPITLVAGILKVRFWTFLVLVAIAKTIRYLAVLGMIAWTTG
ncbi:MAG: YqaA family protein [Pseudomonadota bacterium]